MVRDTSKNGRINAPLAIECSGGFSVKRPSQSAENQLKCAKWKRHFADRYGDECDIQTSLNSILTNNDRLFARTQSPPLKIAKTTNVVSVSTWEESCASVVVIICLRFIHCVLSFGTFSWAKRCTISNKAHKRVYRINKNGRKMRKNYEEHQEEALNSPDQSAYSQAIFKLCLYVHQHNYEPAHNYYCHVNGALYFIMIWFFAYQRCSVCFVDGIRLWLFAVAVAVAPQTHLFFLLFAVEHLFKFDSVYCEHALCLKCPHE